MDEHLIKEILKLKARGVPVSEDILNTIIENGHLSPSSAEYLIKEKGILTENIYLNLPISEEINEAINDLVKYSIVKDRVEAGMLFLDKGFKEYSELIAKIKTQKKVLLEIRKGFEE